MDKYEPLKEQYPEYISLEQLRLICKIAKRSARYLLENGIIPATDTGRITWKWKIALVDVIDYLRTREQSGSMIPTGIANSKKNKKYASGSRKSFSQLVKRDQEQTVVRYFAHLCSEHDDVLTVYDIVDIIGLHKNSVQRLIQSGCIKSIANSPRFLVPKSYLLEFIGTRRFIDLQTNSERFDKILDEFKETILHQPQ